MSSKQGCHAMTAHIDATIQTFLGKLEEHQGSARKIKATVNQLLELDNRPPMFTDVDLESKPTLLNIRRDQFFGRPLATCVKEILEARGAANKGGATTDELFEVLKQGGFDFDSTPGHALRNLGITIGKNMDFRRTPSGVWGLREWYGGTAQKVRSRGKGIPANAADAAASAEEK
jgi:hypothetical protein